MTTHPFSRSHRTGRIWKIRSGRGDGTTRLTERRDVQLLAAALWMVTWGWRLAR